MARVDGLWKKTGSYLKPVIASGINFLLPGSNKYFNFKDVSGELGYGIRDNNGVIEFKNSSGAWTPVGSGSGGTTASETYESVSKNIKSWNYTFNKTGDVLNSIVYKDGSNTITKTFNRTGDVLNSIVLSGNTPSGISLTKTFNRDSNGNLTGISYT